MKTAAIAAVFLGAACCAGTAEAAPCGGDFAAWNATFQREAASKGISARAIAGLDGLTPDPQVISLDRRQGHFSKSFEEFGAPRIAARMSKAQGMLQKHGALLSRIEQAIRRSGSGRDRDLGARNRFRRGHGSAERVARARHARA